MTLSWNNQSVRVAVIVVLTIGAATAAYLTSPGRFSARSASPPAPATTTDELIIGATGDTVLVERLPRSDAGLDAVASLIASTSIAVTNFELTALSEPPRARNEEPRWPAASPNAPRDVRALGFDAISLANNHAHDYGVEGMRETERLAEDAGLVHAGTGNHLAQARAARAVNTPAGRVAFISVAASHDPLSRAAAKRGEIGGRPGVNPLRYTRRVTVNDATFAALKQAFTTGGLPKGASMPADGQLNLFGTTVTKGDRTAVELVTEPEDVTELLDEVARARKSSAAVIVSIHAHEPGNLSDEEPEFLRTVARQAIDAGADLVVGHGPHRLRGIEIHKKRPILYSLGNFIFQDRALHAAAADIFEDATQTILTGIAAPVDDGRAVLDFDDNVWWESVVARATFRRGEFVQLALHPIDLGVGQPKQTRGVPRVASPTVAARVLSRLQRLSEPFKTRIEIREGIGIVTP